MHLDAARPTDHGQGKFFRNVRVSGFAGNEQGGKNWPAEDGLVRDVGLMTSFVSRLRSYWRRQGCPRPCCEKWRPGGGSRRARKPAGGREGPPRWMAAVQEPTVKRSP